MSDLQELFGLPVFDFPDAGTEVALPPVESVAWRVAVEAYESKVEWEDEFARFLTVVDPSRVRALIVGAWSDVYDTDPGPVVEALVGAVDRFPELRSLFVGDISSDQCEISWINQGSLTPLLTAFPGLEQFGARGGQGLELKPVRHESLRRLEIETGGLDAQVVRDIAASDFPALETLDLWLGTSEYGATSAIEDLEPFLTGARLPKLRHLALHNSDMQDQIAAAFAGAPVVARLEVLDLSMGTLSDEGAQALLEGQPLTHLKRLDLSYHYLSEPMAQRVAAALEGTGVEVNLDESMFDEWEQDGDWDNRYVSVGE
ncbi:STM4015 family protein [Streptomyces sp. NPDC020875]|uniref:STM4015 family protein n=1 Tax=Streptomyces sp. NPDC020875 TaxID=3154898 RepID=UPI0033EB16A4